MKAAASITIKAPRETVFNAFADVEHRDRYLSSVTKTNITSEILAGQGVSWHEERQENNVHLEGNLTIKRYTPHKLITIHTKSSGLEYNTNYNFQVVSPNITKVVVSMGGRPGGLLGRFMSRFLSANNEYIKQELQNHLAEYKTAIEKSA